MRRPIILMGKNIEGIRNPRSGQGDNVALEMNLLGGSRKRERVATTTHSYMINNITYIP